MRLPHGLSWVEFAASLAFYRLSCLGEEKKLTIRGHKTHLNSLSHWERAGVRVHRRRKKANNSLKIRVSQLNTRYLPITPANRYHTR